MADPDRPLVADAQAELAQLAADLRRMAEIRWQLARLELDSALGQAKRLAIAWGIAAVMLATGLPVAVICVARFLPERAQVYWLFAFGPVLVLAAILVAWWAWRRFRRKFVGLEETLEELREDQVWCREWLGGMKDEG
jgi:uncharacterized membrane protein YqjE